jgi:RPA family protein
MKDTEREELWNLKDRTILLRALFLIIYNFKIETYHRLTEEFPKTKIDYEPIRIMDDIMHESWRYSKYGEKKSRNKKAKENYRIKEQLQESKDKNLKIILNACLTSVAAAEILK